MLAVRVLGMLGVLLVLSVIVFSLMYLAPGDIVKNLLGNRPTSPEAVAAIRAQYHLDDPLPVDSYARVRTTGGFLLIDPPTGNTLAAGLVGDPLAAVPAAG